MQRRLLTHESSIIGKANVDFDIAYRQLRHRIQCLVTLFVSLRKWALDQSDTDAHVIIEPLETLVTFLGAVKMNLAPDMAMSLRTAKFRRDVKNKVALREAMENFDYPSFKVLTDDLSRCPAPMPEEFESDSGEEDGDTPSRKRRKKKKRRVLHGSICDCRSRRWSSSDSLWLPR